MISGDGDLLDLSGNLMYTPTTVFVDAEGNLVGDAVIGVQKDMEAVFLAAVNQVLAERMRSALQSKAILILRYGLLGASVLLIAIGLARQEHLEVMQKAVRICLECIGIG